MKIGETIRYFIEKEVRRYDYMEWLEEREINAEDMERFLDAGEAALDSSEND